MKRLKTQEIRLISLRVPIGSFDFVILKYIRMMH